MVDLSVSQMENIYSERQLKELSRLKVQHASRLVLEKWQWKSGGSV